MSNTSNMISTTNTSNQSQTGIFIPLEYILIDQISSAIRVAVLLPLAVFLNIFALIAYRYFDRKPTVYFLRSLAIADIFLPLVGADGFAYSASYSGCIMFIFPGFGFYIWGVSMMNLVALAVDQTLAIVFPLKYIIIMTKTRVCIILLSIWFIPLCLIYGISAIVTYIRYVPFSKIKHLCFFLQEKDEEKSLIDALTVCLLSLTVISLLIITALYLKDYSIAKKVFANTRQRSSETKMNYHALRTTVMLVVCLVLTTGPLIVEQMLRMLDIVIALLHIFAPLMCLMNAIMNPIIILLRMRRVREQYSVICCCLCQRCCQKPKQEQSVFRMTESHKTSSKYD